MLSTWKLGTPQPTVSSRLGTPSPVLGTYHSSVLPLLSREIFPYLVVVIGLENVLVLTKSVVSTPVDLEVKLRIAQGKIGQDQGPEVERASPCIGPHEEACFALACNVHAVVTRP